MFGDRTFQFWHYTISHGQLLIRSPRNDRYPRNLDLMFFDVKYSEVPRTMRDVQLREAGPDEVRVIAEKLGYAEKASDIHVLLANGTRYLIVAAIVQAAENDLDLFELPFG